MGGLSPVVVVGDANVDLVLRGDVRPRFGQAEQLLEAADLTLGGSAALVAHGLARLGVPVSLVAAVGDDAFGELTLDLLRGSGVDVEHVVLRPAVPTGISVVLSDGDRAILTHPGAVATLGRADLPDSWPGVGHVHVASPYLVTALRPGLGQVLAGLRSDGVSVSVDTNDDPTRRWTRLADLLGAADTVLPNETEVVRWAQVLGLEHADPGSAADAIAGRGPTVVVKAGGAGGACHRAGSQAVTCAAPAVDVVDTTGAGDSFDAGWIAATQAGHDVETALAWAVTAGALSTRSPGGAQGQPTRDELVAFLDGR